MSHVFSCFPSLSKPWVSWMSWAGRDWILHKDEGIKEGNFVPELYKFRHEHSSWGPFLILGGPLEVCLNDCPAANQHQAEAMFAEQEKIPQEFRKCEDIYFPNTQWRCAGTLLVATLSWSDVHGWKFKWDDCSSVYNRHTVYAKQV